jgi:hypothetical protein
MKGREKLTELLMKKKKKKKTHRNLDAQNFEHYCFTSNIVNKVGRLLKSFHE